MLERIAILALLAAVFCTSGCASSRQTTLAAQPHGQVMAGSQQLQGATSAVVQSTKRTGSQLVASVKGVLSSSKKSTIVDRVPQDDPTRLDNMPANVSADLYVAAARLSERNGRLQQALEQYEMALKQDERDRDAMIGLARLSHRRGDTDRAIRTYHDALKTYKGDPVILNDLGLCYARSGELQEAIHVLGAAAAAAPDRELYANNLASCLVEANRPADAVAQLSRLQGPAKANYSVGYLLDQRGRRAEAERHLQQALAMDPDLYQARALLEQTPRLSARVQLPATTSPRPGLPAPHVATTTSHLPPTD